MDWTGFSSVAVKGVPLLFVVMGLVEWFKLFKKADGSQKFNGNTLLMISLGWGLLVGSGYMISQTRPPAIDWWLIYIYWFGVIVYGLAMGLVASGLFDAVKNLALKIIENVISGQAK